MCGIVGEYRFDEGSVNATRLTSQVEMIRHRGPDALRTWNEGSVGFGHARLSIIDVAETGAQPMFSIDGQFVLIYNGEIYNYKDLRRRLEGKYVFRGTSDTEVLLYSFAQWGAECFDLLEGMFTIAIYDRRERELWLARDGFGIKPLYLHRNASRIQFCSEIRPLLLDPETPRIADLEALRQYVLLGYAIAPKTPFQNVEMLPPGHFVRIRPDGSMAQSVFWSPDRLLTAEQRNFDEVFEEAAALHVQADVPAGIMLSGGIDSSLLVAALSRARAVPPDFRAFNVGLDADDAMTDRDGRLERDAAVRTADSYGIPLTRIHPNDCQRVSIAEIIESVEEPICNPSNQLIDLIARSARERGTKVLLSGHGGDEMFAGYRRHVWVRYMGLIRKLYVSNVFRSVARASKMDLLTRMAANLREGPESVLSIVAPGWNLVHEYGVSPEFMSPAATTAAAAPLLDMIARTSELTPLKQVMLLDIQTYLVQNLINMDKSSMRRSVEVRVPFLYRPLAAIGMQLEERKLIRNFRNKTFLRRAAKRQLPPFLLKVPKLGFGPAPGQLLKSAEARDLLYGSSAKQRGLFDQDAIRAMLHNPAGGVENSRMMQVYSLIAIEQWFRSFIDRDPLSTNASHSRAESS